ncbi:MAG: gliding motility-associated C-terminal domain-containing protein [Saprospiraceae bacterium]|nr:gliding motility-associated C-terminal domain-containing protein [Saprospiraceae bacterium]
MKMYKFIALVVISCCTLNLEATHNRAGEISFIQLSDFSIQATITTYTKASSTAADRDSLIINWGDGSSSTVLRSNGSGELLSNNTKRNYYIATHNYPGRSTYKISVMDPNRVDNILNIDPPNSVNIPFYIQTTVSLLNLQFQSPNRSVQLLQAPIDFACVGVVFQHNPAAYDADGDSLSFEFSVPLMDNNLPVPNYIFPNQINPGINNAIMLDSQKGTFTWASPQKAGEYNIAFIIHEYRKGVRIASTIRDMQIFVRQDCSKNTPPVITSAFDTCIVAGTILELPITVTDPDTLSLGSKIKIEVSGAPFFTSPTMVLMALTSYTTSPINAKLTWVTDCSLVRKEFYTLVIKATDNILDSTGISSLHTLRIKVVGPAPENLQSEADSKSIKIKWNHPYACTHFPDYFKGFSVWRKEGSSNIPLDTCNPGLQASSYKQIAYLVNNFDGMNYHYQDSTIVEGKFYCYRVQAEFATTSQSGFPINFVSSLHSNETCNSLPLNIPVLLNVDVTQTDSLLGEISVRWTKPSPIEFDTIKFKAPYKTSIYFKTKNNQWEKILNSEHSYNSYSSIIDTIFHHTRLNTAHLQYSYYVELLSTPLNEHFSDSADMIFLSTQGSDRSLTLNWNAVTPWTNYKYDIFLFNNNTLVFDSIASTNLNTFTIQKLTNELEYCVYIKGYGAYGVSRFEKPLINHSNISCATAIDNIPPCCPKLMVSDPCDDELQTPGLELKNKLSWTFPDICKADDAIGYKIYAYYNKQQKLIQTIENVQTQTYEHFLLDSIPECYLVTTYDLAGNECINVDSVCIEYCPIYNLPNTFTPNSDGHNDLFKPFPYRFIDKVEFKVFNRWGNLVFQTENPDILWDGKSSSGSRLSDGTYYYTCLVYYSGLLVHSNPTNQLNGFIELRSGQK